MTYAYGMKGAPSVGRGLGGLPLRAVAEGGGGALIIDKEFIAKSNSASAAVDLGAPIEYGRTFICVTAINSSGIYGVASRLENFPVCRDAYFYCAPKPGGNTSLPGFGVLVSGSAITVSPLNGTDRIYLRVFTVKNKIKSLQSVNLYRPASTTDVLLSTKLSNPEKVFYGILGISYGSNGNNSFCGKLTGFGDFAVSPFTSDSSGTVYSGVVGFLDGGTVRLYESGGTGGSGSSMDIVELG